jgi:type I restriction enzyme, S subunit
MVNSKQVPVSEAYWFQEGPGVRNWQFTTSGVKLLNVGNITKDGNIDLDKTDKHISLDEAEGKYSHFLVDEGDLVIASSGISFDEDGMLRTRGAFIETKHLPLCLNTSTIRFKAIEGISDLNFFKFWLDSFEFRDQVSRLVTGSAQQNFGPSHLKIINISLPPLTEQKRIASLLARADRMRQLRRTAHDLSGSVLQSVFLEMFGHVRVNDKKWELAKFEDVCETRLGKMLDDKKQTGKHKRPYLRNFNVRWDSLDLSDIAEMDFDEKDRKEFRLQYGDVLICEGGEVGRAAIWRNEMEECYFQKALHRARPNSELANPEYIVHLLWRMAQTGGLVDSTSQVTFAHLTGEKLKELVIPIPPLSLQEEFAGVVARVESLRARMSEAERQVEGLFESLLSNSFGG